MLVGVQPSKISSCRELFGVASVRGPLGIVGCRLHGKVAKFLQQSMYIARASPNSAGAAVSGRLYYTALVCAVD